ncbi:hypothetical protein F5Y10DRAFT_238400 [Nemania abortiva]|nr:hypothetical protein F5Y10DRAFT_238400 [Nemania abortiva]
MKLSDLGDGFGWNDTMGITARAMIDTGFEVWGFLIYRCTYGDDDVWDRYMTHLKEAVHKDLDILGRDILMEQYAQWTVIEDKETLDGASKQEVRERFIQWRDQNSVSRELSEATQLVRTIMPMQTDASTRLPRFTYCLYVDQKCLDTLAAHVDAKATDLGLRLPPPLVVVIIDGDYPDQRPREWTWPNRDSGIRYSDVEGCTQKYVGWMYISTDVLASLYDRLHNGRLDEWGGYSRPPEIWPTGTQLISGGVSAFVLPLD